MSLKPGQERSKLQASRRLCILVPVLVVGVITTSLIVAGSRKRSDSRDSPSPSPLDSSAPTDSPTGEPTPGPTKLATADPTTSPSKSPSRQQTDSTNELSYVPGELSVLQLKWRLSTGLSARVLAQSGEPVVYDKNQGQSSIPFHVLPDMGGTFEDPRRENKGGWIYVSNSEARQPRGTGGVGALTFDKNGFVTDYRMVLEGTTANCGGGRTKWNAWISCEEYKKAGMIWQVDPTGRRKARNITLGRGDPANYESFAYDGRKSHYFVTEDHEFGPLRRFIPARRDRTDPWQELLGRGETTYLRLIPSSDRKGSYKWIKNKNRAKLNANAFYPNAEGIDVDGHQLFFISKKLKTMFVLDLDDETYTSHSTRSGVFKDQPDQLQRIIGANDGLLYFTEDGGKFAGVHARNRRGQFFTILEAPASCNETTGLAFSPNGQHLYIADQDRGTVLDVTRDDGLPFHARTLNIQYHANFKANS